MSETQREFKVGDTVRLRSGGPVMTVTYVIPGNLMVDCEWYDAGEFIKKTFRDAVLKKVNVL